MATNGPPRRVYDLEDVRHPEELPVVSSADLIARPDEWELVDRDRFIYRRRRDSRLFWAKYAAESGTLI